MKIPLILTLFRMVLSPLFVVVYLFATSWGVSFKLLPYLLLFIVIICEITDALDGFLARLHNQVTNLGKVLDPMADSFFRLSVFFAFTQGVLQIPLWVVIIFFWRDALVNTLRSLLALEGVPLAARMSGKIKAVLQAITTIFILLLMLVYADGYIDLYTLRKVSKFVTLGTALYTFCSGCEYIWICRKFLVDAIGVNRTAR